MIILHYTSPAGCPASLSQCIRVTTCDLDIKMMKYLMMTLKAAVVCVVRSSSHQDSGFTFNKSSLWCPYLKIDLCVELCKLLFCKSGRTLDLLFLCSCISGENSARIGGLQEMNSQICSRHVPLVCPGIKCESSYESETRFRAQYAVFEKGPTISLLEPAASSRCPQRSVEGRRGSRLLQRCQSQFQTSRS